LTVTVSKEALPPKAPANYYALWLRDWISTQPKVENVEGAQVNVKKGAQIWNTVPEHEKQVNILIVMFSRPLNAPIAIPREISCPAG
jgi:hypothetical protein